MGMYCEVTAASAEEFDPSAAGSDTFGSGFHAKTATADGVSLEKAWHGLHYLLTGEVEEGDGPAAFLLAGGEVVGDDEDGIRWFTPQETAQIHRALSAVTERALWSRFDAARMEQLGIYPGIWDEAEEDLKDEYLTYFHELKQVVAAAAQSGRGLVVTIG